MERSQMRFDKEAVVTATKLSSRRSPVKNCEVHEFVHKEKIDGK